jgi:hypothetical protein
MVTAQAHGFVPVGFVEDQHEEFPGYAGKLFRYGSPQIQAF